jgi:hypothetical protein
MHHRREPRRGPVAPMMPTAPEIPAQRKLAQRELAARRFELPRPSP